MGINTVRYALEELWRYRARTFTNILGYAIAIALMIGTISILESHNKEAVEILKGTGTHFMIFIPQSQSSYQGTEYGGPFAEGVYTSMIDEGSLKAIRDLPGVRDAAPYLLFKIFDADQKSFRTIGGIKPSLATSKSICAPTNILQGRFLDPSDKKVVIVEESYARSANLSVNDSIRAFNRELKIVGIVNSGIRPAKADIYAPIGLVQEIVGDYGLTDARMNIVVVEVADARIQKEVMASVKNVLAGSTISSYGCHIPASSVISITGSAAWAISLTVAFFAMLISAKSQLASVVERTKDIGILKSLGWSGSAVMQQILTESIIQAIAGGAAGCVLAVLVSFFLLGSLEGISLLAIAGGIALALVGGILAGTFPAWRAYKLRPAEALRRL